MYVCVCSAATMILSNGVFDQSRTRRCSISNGHPDPQNNKGKEREPNARNLPPFKKGNKKNMSRKKISSIPSKSLSVPDQAANVLYMAPGDGVIQNWSCLCNVHTAPVEQQRQPSFVGPLCQSSTTCNAESGLNRACDVAYSACCTAANLVAHRSGRMYLVSA